MVTSIDSSLLMSIYNVRSGVGGGLSGVGGSTVQKRVAPTAPWVGTGLKPADTTAAVRSVMMGRRFINESAAQLDLPGASADYRKLFALYQGLSTLMGVVTEAQKKNLTGMETSRVHSTFARGMEEITNYAGTADFDKLRLTEGTVATSARTTAPVVRAKTEYVTGVLHAGTSNDAVAAFAGNVEFTIKVRRSGVDYDVNVNLADMGAQTRSMANVVNFINGKLQAAGVDTRFSTVRTPGQDRTTTVDGKTIKLGPGPDQWAMKIRPSGEKVSFVANATAGAVYMAQGVGNPDPDGKPTTNDGVIAQQLVKFQTDNAAVAAPVQGQTDTYWVDGRAFARTMGPEVKAVRATKVGADGSVYMLADIVNKTAGQDIKGDQDVALLKYDPAGNLVFTRTLGASQSATGLGLAISADGKVAVAGAVTGALIGAVDGPMNSGPTGSFADQPDSFVTVYDAEGQELWTQRRGARLADEASQLAFGADGTVYVAGRAKSGMPGAPAIGDWDSYIEAFKPPDAEGKVVTAFTKSFGSTAADRPAGMVLDGTSLVTASVENGRAVLRRFDISSGAPVLSATRDLGDLQGGEITGLALDGGQLVIAGSTTNGALSAGTVTMAHHGGTDAFAAKISANLGPGGSIAYYGGAGNDRASSLAVAGGQVWIAGSAGADLPGHANAVGKKDGFLARLDVDAGTVAWSRRFTGKDGYAAPGAIAVDPTGSSALDRMGLPRGELDLSDSQRITAATSIRPGDEFTVRMGTGRPKTITIETTDTIDTLAQKIRRATGFQAKVSLSTVEGMRRLTIAPLNDRMVIELGPGRAGKDALSLLGLEEGVVRATEVDKDGKTVPADGKGQIYGLKLDSKLNLKDEKEIAHAAAEISAAMGVIRQIYKDLVAAASPKSAQDAAAAAAAAGGKVPVYLQNQIANYQAALNRLTGGG